RYSSKIGRRYSRPLRIHPGLLGRRRVFGRHRRCSRRAELERRFVGCDGKTAELITCERIQGLPGRHARSGFYQLNADTHLDRVACERSEVALDQAELVGSILIFKRALSLASEPYLVNEDTCFRRHVAMNAPEQDERAHRFAISLR